MRLSLLLLTLAIVLRLFFIVFTIHPDIRGYNMAAQWIAEGEVLTFYDHMRLLPRDTELVKQYGDELLIYPPLAYLYPAVFKFVTNPIFPHQTWNDFLIEMNRMPFDSNYVFMVLLLKLPYLIPDLLIAFLLPKFFKTQKQKTLVNYFWLLNPIVIYATYCISQFDVLIALCILLSILATQNKRYFLAAFSLGIAAGFKPFPLLLLPILTLVSPINIRNKILQLSIGIGTYALLLLPYLASTGFRQYALVASQTDKIFFAKIPLSGAEFIPLFLFSLVFIYFLAFFKPKRFDVWQWYVLPLICFYIFVHFHPQWFLWGLPLLAIYFAIQYKQSLYLYIVLLISYFGQILLFESSLNVGLFRIINPSLFEYSLLPMLTKIQPEIILRSIITTIFAVTLTFILISILSPAFISKRSDET